MASHTEMMMRDYFRDAPPSAFERYREPAWDKVHVGWQGGVGCARPVIERRTALPAACKGRSI